MAWFSDKKQNMDVKRLIGMLRNSDANKRNNAARQLIALGADSAPGLVAALGGKDQALSTFVPQILVRIGVDAIPALSEAIRAREASNQIQAATVLGEIGNSAALPILLQILPSKNYKVQVATALALGKINDKSVMPQLLNTLSDNDPDVRIAVARAIAGFRLPKTYLNLADLLDDPEINVRQAAAQALAETDDPSVIPYLVEALYDSFWWYGREEAMQVLQASIRKFGTQAYAPLAEAMNAKEPTVRRYAISLLAPLKDSRSLEPLQMAFYDPNYDVAEMAATAMIGYGPTAMSIFVEALSSPNDWIREKSVESIAKIGGREAVNYLLKTLNDSESSVRIAAINALGQLKDRYALPALDALAANRDEREISRLARQAIAAIHAG
ncbi:MAG: HEAT repeat domain-containing protein [Anaerolineae bacterium]|jgi:HEAT repeat protein|nr:HEAT repeat domain-containing protein [Anaerolineae bacterium]MBT7069293.1 HEAT repeat domain-containing protein [Anaerolineae bacterium]MBT7325991.1 HEAT repeat domain-containing protein [Anaerolineae bacterium]